MTNAHHTLDGTNVIVGQHIVHEESTDGHRLMTAEQGGHTILVEDPMTHKLLQDSNHRLITQDNQQILVAQDATMSHRYVSF